MRIVFLTGFFNFLAVLFTVCGFYEHRCNRIRKKGEEEWIGIGLSLFISALVFLGRVHTFLQVNLERGVFW